MSKLNQTIYIVIILYKLVFTKYKLFITIKTTKSYELNLVHSFL